MGMGSPLDQRSNGGRSEGDRRVDDTCHRIAWPIIFVLSRVGILDFPTRRGVIWENNEERNSQHLLFRSWWNPNFCHNFRGFYCLYFATITTVPSYVFFVFLNLTFVFGRILICPAWFGRINGIFYEEWILKSSSTFESYFVKNYMMWYLMVKFCVWILKKVSNY